MARCDLCGAPASRARNPIYSAQEFRLLVANGFGPDQATLAGWARDAGTSEADALADWQRRVAQEVEWLLCANCAARSATHRKESKRTFSWWIPVIALVALVTVAAVVVTLGRAPKARARSFKPHDLAVVISNSIAIAPDGQTLVAATSDKLVEVWDIASGDKLITLTGHTQSVTGVSFAPDGRLLASGSLDGTIRLWNARALRSGGGEQDAAGILTGHALGVSAIAFSPDGRWLASSSHDHTVALWDLATVRSLAAPTRSLTQAQSGVAAVSFSPDGRFLASGSLEGAVQLWRWVRLIEGGSAAPAPDSELMGSQRGITSLAFSPDGLILAAGSLDGTIKLWRVETALASDDPASSLVRTLTEHRQAVNAVAFSSDGRTLASGSADGMVRLWDAATWETRRTLIGYDREPYPVTSLAFSADGRWLAVGNEFDVKLWDMTRQQ